MTDRSIEGGDLEEMSENKVNYSNKTFESAPTPLENPDGASSLRIVRTVWYSGTCAAAQASHQ